MLTRISKIGTLVHWPFQWTKKILAAYKLLIAEYANISRNLSFSHVWKFVSEMRNVLK